MRATLCAIVYNLKELKQEPDYDPKKLIFRYVSINVENIRCALHHSNISTTKHIATIGNYTQKLFRL